ncbi:hypothetical protein BCR37DRAFT_392908 [Protomyces lactucae-debilis]|uniref:Uncharacterized protein n=1 Tax=Protomyces lactucae-debilis TaxID=2754530 RepID=A0A1Y2FGG3_PROLT|nr:uncharacterized protein BCR37DRAFT_392908 [Protomyces lactucae-debilis]ORY82707.1 hypothetical protein BCR37DRAFT_392908 [Protomyces lactucae-debilis]
MLSFEADVHHDWNDRSLLVESLLSTPVQQGTGHVLTPSTGHTDRSDLVQDSQVFSLPPLHLSALAVLQKQSSPTRPSPAQVSTTSASSRSIWDSKFVNHLYVDHSIHPPQPYQPPFQNRAFYGKSVTPQSDERTTDRGSTNSSPEQKRPSVPVEKAMPALLPAFIEAEATSPFYCADSSQMIEKTGLMLPPLSPARGKKHTRHEHAVETSEVDTPWPVDQVYETFELPTQHDTNPPFLPDFLIELPQPKPKVQKRRLISLERGYWAINARDHHLSQSALDDLWKKLEGCIKSASLAWVSLHRIPSHLRVYCWAGCAMSLWVLIREYCKPNKLRAIAWYDAEGKLVLAR